VPIGDKAGSVVVVVVVDDDDGWSVGFASWLLRRISTGKSGHPSVILELPLFDLLSNAHNHRP